VANEEMKIDKFKKGFQPTLKTNMATLSFLNFQMMWRKAIRVKHVIDECKVLKLAIQ